MCELTFEEAYPVARALAHQKSLSVVGCCGLTAADREDIEADLLLDFYVRFSKFDGQRASIRTFASRVMDKELTSILRYHLAVRRRHLAASDLSDECGEHHANGVDAVPADAQRHQFWVDVDRALASVPAALRETALALCWSSPSELSRALGRSRTIIYARIHRLREAFLAAGIGPAYFVSSGARQ